MTFYPHLPFTFILSLALMGAYSAQGNQEFKSFDRPGILVGGREDRSVMDSGDFVVVELRENEEPLDYTLGPLKTSEGAVIEFRAKAALENVSTTKGCTLSLLARDKRMNELSSELALIEPDYSKTVPVWQNLTARAVMPPETEYVELRIHIEEPMKLHLHEDGIQALGVWVQPQKDELKEVISITNNMIELSFDPQTQVFRFLDLRSQQEWETFALPPSFGLEAIQSGKMSDGQLVIAVQGVYFPYTTPFRMVMLLAPEQPKVVCRMELDPSLTFAPNAGRIQNVPRLNSSNPDHFLVVPIGDRMLYPVKGKEIPELTWRLQTNPAWFGITSGPDGPGVVCIVDAFVHAELSFASLDYQTQGNGNTVQIAWLPHNGIWNYPREVTFWFTETGGPDALANYFFQRNQPSQE